MTTHIPRVSIISYRALFLLVAPVFLVGFFALPSFAEAANRYWVGTSTDWSNTNNWSATSGGVGGATVPGVNDAAF
ncbi:MAG: hypothetical protein AAB570_01075, partial [Patescibacteria group bacterium]